MPKFAKSHRWLLMLIVGITSMLMLTAQVDSPDESTDDTSESPLQIYFTEDAYYALPNQPIIVNTTLYNVGDAPLQDVTVTLTPLTDGLRLQYDELFSDEAMLGVLQAGDFRNSLWAYVAEGRGTYRLQADVTAGDLSFSDVTEIIVEPRQPHLASYRAGVVTVTNGLQGGRTIASYPFGSETTTAVIGDWNGDGYAGLGIFDGTQLLLRNGMLPRADEDIDNLQPDKVITFDGVPADATFLVGDFNGNGADSVAFYGQGLFFIYDYLNDRITTPDRILAFDTPNATPLVGDWDGDGVDTVGLYQDGVFVLYNTRDAETLDITFEYGPTVNATPLIGDWNGDGVDTVGVILNNTLLITNRLEGGTADNTITLTPPFFGAQVFVDFWKTSTD